MAGMGQLIYHAQLGRKQRKDESRRSAIFNAIDTYTPLSQAVVVAFSSLEDQFEITTVVVKF